MFERLHNAGFTQESVYPRNFLVQPGPLRVNPDLRTMDKPSFRIIDFGRGHSKTDAPKEAFNLGIREDVRNIVRLMKFKVGNY